MKHNTLLVILLLLSVLYAQAVIASVAGTSLPKDPKTGMRELRIYPGETGGIAIYPQNDENESIYFKIEFILGKEYLIEELEEEYIIPPHTLSDDFKINLTFKAPKNASIGDKFRVEYKMSSTTSKEREEGMVGIAPASFVKRFDIVIVPKEEKPIPTYIYFISFGIILALIIIITAIILVKLKKKKKH